MARRTPHTRPKAKPPLGTTSEHVIEVGPKGQAVLEAQWADPKPSPGLVELFRQTR